MRCIDTQQERRDAGLLGRQRKTTADGEIVPAAVPSRLNHHRPEPCTAQTVSRRLEQGARIRRDGKNQPCRIKPDFGETRRMKTSPLLVSFLTQPQQRQTCGRSAHRQHKRETGGARPIFPRIRDKFMQPSLRQTSAQLDVDGFGANGEQPVHARMGMAFQQSDMLLQRSKRDGRLTHNVPDLFYRHLQHAKSQARSFP